NDHARRYTLLRIQTEIAHAAGDDQANVTVAQIILPDGLQHCFGHRARRHRDFQTNRTRRIPEPIEMFVQSENAAVVKTDALKNSVAVEQTVIEYGNHCL